MSGPLSKWTKLDKGYSLSFSLTKVPTRFGFPIVGQTNPRGIGIGAIHMLLWERMLPERGKLEADAAKASADCVPRIEQTTPIHRSTDTKKYSNRANHCSETTVNLGTPEDSFFFPFRRTKLPAYARKQNTLGRNHSATPSTLGTTHHYARCHPHHPRYQPRVP